MPTNEEIIKKKLKRLKETHPDIDTEHVERELFPLTGEDVSIKTVKKKKRA